MADIYFAQFSNGFQNCKKYQNKTLHHDDQALPGLPAHFFWVSKLGRACTLMGFKIGNKVHYQDETLSFWELAIKIHDVVGSTNGFKMLEIVHIHEENSIFHIKKQNWIVQVTVKLPMKCRLKGLCLSEVGTQNLSSMSFTFFFSIACK